MMTTTNFFSGVAALNIIGDLQLLMRKGIENNWVVSVMLHNEQCGDDAKHLIPPFNLKGTAEELDRAFFDRIHMPLQAASALMDNMEAFMKQMEAAKKQSVMEKEKAEKEKKEKEAREKKYKEAMAKADELEKEGKHREAWMKVPEPSDYPEYGDAIRKRRKELSDQFASPSLFGAEQEPIV